MNELKCKRCKSEWVSPENRQSIFCPFCRAPLIEVKEKFDDLSTALSYMVLKFGTDILRNRQNTLQLLEVFFLEGKREYIFIDNLYSLGLMDILFRLQKSPSAIQKSAMKQVSKQLCEKCGASKDWSEYIVGCVCKALGITSDAAEMSIINLKRSAEQRNPAAQVALAKRFRTGQGVDKDLEKYVYWLGEAAKRDYAEAQFLLGKELYNGHICQKNVSSALLYLVQAVKNDSIDAMCFILSNVEIGALKTLDLKNIENYLLERKEELLSSQLVELSEYFEKYDLTQSLELAKLAYVRDAKSAWQYYVALLNKVGSYESKAIALKVTKDIATAGNVIACLLLAKRYEYQATTKNDMLIALYWYRMAAESGEVEAQLHLGEIYENGELVKQDIDNAIYWYRVAAYNGSQYAKAKISYKSPNCIVKTLTLVFEDDAEIKYRVLGVENYLEADYLVIEDPETKEYIAVKCIETDTIEGFEVEEVDTKTEKIVLNKFGGDYY